MNIELSEGRYKILSYGRLYEILEVKKNSKGKLVYSINATPERPIDEIYDNEDIQVLKKIHPLDPIVQAQFHITWQDMEQDTFKLSASSTTRFRQILDWLPNVMERLKDRTNRKK